MARLTPLNEAEYRRRRAGVAQADLAREWGRSQSFVSRAERGEIPLTAEEEQERSEVLERLKARRDRGGDLQNLPATRREQQAKL